MLQASVVDDNHPARHADKIDENSIIPSSGQDCRQFEIPQGLVLFDFKTMRSKYSTESVEGMVIGQISIITLSVFNMADPRENNPLYSFVNDIHSPTMDYVIQRQLLFKEGGRLQNQQVLESERILRSNSYISDAIIIPNRVCGNKVDLTVIVRDLWTLMPKLLYSRKGGNNKYGLTIEDENILGTGNRMFVQFLHERERDSATVGFRTKQLLGTHVILDATYSDTTDGINKKLVLNRPFYSLDTRWSIGLRAEEFSYVESLEAFDEDLNAFDHVDNEYQVSVGYSTGLIQGVTQRYTFGFNRTEDLFQANADTVVTQPADRVLSYPWVSYSFVEDDYVIYRNLNALYRTEDVPVGTSFSMVLGYGDESFNSKLNQWIFGLNLNASPLRLEKHLFKTGIEINGFWDRDTEEFLNMISSLSMSYYSLIAPKHRGFIELSYDYGENLTQDALLPLGGDEDLRGYPSEYLLGDRRFLLNVEYRYFMDVHYMNLLRFAGVVFFDAGQTKMSPVVPGSGFGQDSDLLTSTGFGLRINSSKTNISRIVHIDLAFPMNEKDNVDRYQLRITSEATF